QQLRPALAGYEDKRIGQAGLCRHHHKATPKSLISSSVAKLYASWPPGFFYTVYLHSINAAKGRRFFGTDPGPAALKAAGRLSGKAAAAKPASRVSAGRAYLIMIM